MADEVDTQAAPEVEVQAEGEATEPMGNEAEAQEPAPQERQFDPDEFGEKIFQRSASWMGRRTKGLEDQISQLANTVNQLARYQQQVSTPPPEFDFENPVQFVDQRVEQAVKQMKERETRQQQEFQNGFVQGLYEEIQNDPLYVEMNQDGQPVPTELGNEIWQAIDSGKVKIDRSLPPNVAARDAFAKANMLVIRERANAKRNPLSGNKPKNQVQGGIQPKSGAGNRAPRVDLSPEAQRLAAAFGMDEDKIRKYLNR